MIDPIGGQIGALQPSPRVDHYLASPETGHPDCLAASCGSQPGASPGRVVKVAKMFAEAEPGGLAHVGSIRRVEAH
jgi:hypothetical protein